MSLPYAIDFRNVQGDLLGKLVLEEGPVVRFEGNMETSAKMFFDYLNDTHLSSYAKENEMLEQHVRALLEKCKDLERRLAVAQGDVLGDQFGL